MAPVCVSPLWLAEQISQTAWLQQQTFISHSSEGHTSKTKVQSGLDSGGGGLSSWLVDGNVLLSPHTVERQKSPLPVPVFIKVLSHYSLSHVTSFNLNYLPKGTSSPNTVTGVIRASAYEWVGREDRIQPIPAHN